MKSIRLAVASLHFHVRCFGTFFTLSPHWERCYFRKRKYLIFCFHLDRVLPHKTCLKLLVEPI